MAHLLTGRGGRPLAPGATRTARLLTGTAITSGTVPLRVTGLASTGATGGTLTTVWNAYPGASFYRQEASTDGGTTYVSWGRTAATNFSKSGLANGIYTVRVIAMTGQVNGADDIAGSTSDPITVTIAAGASAGGGTTSGGTSTGTSGGTSVPPQGGTSAGSGTITLVPNPAGTVPFYVGNYGSAAATNPRLVWAQGFALGEIPAGSRPVADAFPDLQQGMESYYADGSLRCASFAGTYSGTLAAGANAPAPLKKAAGSPTRTGGKTLADVRALGVRMEVRDGVNGPVSRTLSLATLIDAFGAQAGWTFGQDALGGVTIVNQGPTCIDVVGWGALRGPDGTGYDRWLRGYLLVRLWSDGVREIAGGIGHENTYGPHPGGTFGQATALPMQSFSLRAEVFDAQGLVPLCGGGPNDPGVETWSASNLPGGSAVNPPGGSAIAGQGVPVVFAGAGAGSLEAGRAYCIHYGRLCLDYEGEQAASYTAGSGTVTATPMLQLKAGSLLWLFGPDGERAMRGGTRPTVLPGHDTDYAARAGMFPRMDRRVAATPLGFTPRHRTNRWWSDYNTEGTGDSARELRVGSVNFPECSALLRPFDRDYDRFCRALGLSVLVAPWAWTDHRRAQPAVVDGGPNRDDTTTYPGLGPLNRELRYYRGNAYGPGSPAWYIPDFYLNELLPFRFNYNVLDFAAHQPDHGSLAYYKSGDWAFIKSKVHNANVYAVCPQPGERDKAGAGGEKLRGNVFFGPQPRAIAWGLRSIRTALTIVPDAHPYKPVLVNSIVDSGKWIDFWRTQIDQKYVDMGDITADSYYGPDNNLQPWHNAFLVSELSMAVKCGWTGLLPALQWVVKGNFIDVMRPSKGGSTWWAGSHHLELTADRSTPETRKATYFTNVRDMLAKNLSSTSLTPETVPADNIWGGGFGDGYNGDPYYFHPRSYASIKRGALTQVVDVLDRIGASAAGEQIAASAAVLADLDARMARAPLNGGLSVADDPVWAFIPERQAV